MKSGVHKFNSPRAMAVFEQIEKVLPDHGGASTWDLAALAGAA